MPTTAIVKPANPIFPIVRRGPKNKYGVTEKKKSELDALTLKVLNAQQEVDQFTAIVTALTEKLTSFQVFLNTADTNRTQALNQKTLVEQLVNSVSDLVSNSGIALNETIVADQSMQQVATEIRIVMNRLIYTAELLNKLSNVVIRRKALNPLISTDLVSRLAKAGTDANNAVALTLVALNASFAAQASGIESKAVTALELKQSMALEQLLTGRAPDASTLFSIGKVAGTDDADSTAGSLQQLLRDSYEKAKLKYEQAQDAFIRTTNQLNNTKASLSKAQVKLKSLQAGLAAANAAAFA